MDNDALDKLLTEQQKEHGPNHCGRPILRAIIRHIIGEAILRRSDGSWQTPKEFMAEMRGRLGEMLRQEAETGLSLLPYSKNTPFDYDTADDGTLTLTMAGVLAGSLAESKHGGPDDEHGVSLNDDDTIRIRCTNYCE